MPAAITHYLHAERVLEKLEQEHKSLSVNRNAFLWGAQGPDFLYCHRVLPWQRGKSLRDYAGKLHHEAPERVLQSMKSCYLQSGKAGTVLSYLYGFLCHYSLDRIGHPYIHFCAWDFGKQYSGQNEESLHNRIESALDVILLRYEKGDLPTEFHLKKTVPKDASVQTNIAHIYSFLLYQLYGAQEDEHTLCQATADCRLIFGLLFDRTGLKKQLVERLEGRESPHGISCHIRGVSEEDDFDYANILHSAWQWPLESSLARKDSFFELYESAVADSVSLIENYLSTSSLNDLTKGIPFV
ncbi:MAG TPA: zinc dependent phospholipase C family protein [Caproiciproducens sp.]|nr:zinc dependent phospholipase C family protein [Caproiciproducens sp.]